MMMMMQVSGCSFACLKVSVACRARHASDHDIFMRLQDDGLQGERCMMWAGALAAKATALSLPEGSCQSMSLLWSLVYSD